MKKTLGLILGPILFSLFLLFFNENEREMNFVLALSAWMIVWWTTEAVPIPITALLPIIVLPLSSYFTITEVCKAYASPIIFLFMGGFMIALALEKHNIHQRLALNILRLTGSSSNGIIGGFMIATGSLSMWISNTATAVMMLPIANSVINLLSKHSSSENQYNKFSLSLMLAIAYAANIGGTMTIIGTPPNVVMVGYIKELLNKEVSFFSWMLFGVPTGILLIMITYWLLTKFSINIGNNSIKGFSKLIQKELIELDKISKPEKLVLTIFILTGIGWIFKPQINTLIGADVLTDHITSMIGGCLMFCIPINFKKREMLLEWEIMKKMPWGILILFGGGISLANAMSDVGIISEIGAFVKSLNNIPIFLLILSVSAIVLTMTEFMSNVALAVVFIPIIIGVGNGLEIEPIILVVAVTIASSCAFMMPISTPPNAIVYSSGYIKIKDMVKIGLILNIFAILILTLVCYFVLPFFSSLIFFSSI